jgi:hypothetical protein
MQHLNGLRAGAAMRTRPETKMRPEGRIFLSRDSFWVLYLAALFLARSFFQI